MNLWFSFWFFDFFQKSLSLTKHTYSLKCPDAVYLACSACAHFYFRTMSNVAKERNNNTGVEYKQWTSLFLLKDFNHRNRFHNWLDTENSFTLCMKYDLKGHFYVIVRCCDFFPFRPSDLITTLTYILMNNFCPCF